MTVAIRPAQFDEVRALRDVYRDEMRCQIIHDSIHERPGWTLEYLITIDTATVGYGSVAIGGPWRDAAALYEFFVERQQRSRICDCFERLLEATDVARLETQSNDPVLAPLLLAYGRDIRSECVLFEDGGRTSMAPAGVAVRGAVPEDRSGLAAAGLDPAAGWVAVYDEALAGAGGILTHYNHPYGDLYMAVAEPFRRRGIGAFLVQELKRACYAQGGVPAARCGTANTASRRTLQRAGLVPCGAMLTATVGPGRVG